jgi:pyruvate dehydrogenase (quinone)
MIVAPEQARRKVVAACQAALTRRGVAVCDRSLSLH